MNPEFGEQDENTQTADSADSSNITSQENTDSSSDSRLRPDATKPNEAPKSPISSEPHTVSAEHSDPQSSREAEHQAKRDERLKPFAGKHTHNIQITPPSINIGTTPPINSQSNQETAGNNQQHTSDRAHSDGAKNHTPEDPSNRAIHALSLMLDLEQAARRAETLDTLRFVIVNRTYELIRFDRCVLFEDGPFGLRVSAISNLPIINREAPFVLWLQEYVRDLEKKRQLTKPILLQAADQDAILRGRWLELVPPYAQVMPLQLHDGHRAGIMIIFGENAWPENEVVLLRHIGEAYAYTLAPFIRKRVAPMLRKRRTYIQWGIILALLAICFIPTRQKTLAPAEVTPLDSTLLSSPIKGIIKEILVEPNSEIKAGQIVMRLEEDEYRNAYSIAERSYRLAETNLHKATQEAFENVIGNAEVALARAELAKSQVELDLARNRYERVEVRSPTTGTVIYRDKTDYIGQPVSIGQRLFLIADPGNVELTIELPTSSGIPVKDNAEVRFFQNNDPLNPLDGELIYHSIQAEASESGTSSYRLRAKLTANQAPPRLGSKGTAHIYGDTTLFFLYVFRKPLSLVRQYIGI